MIITARDEIVLFTALDVEYQTLLYIIMKCASRSILETNTFDERMLGSIQRIRKAYGLTSIEKLIDLSKKKDTLRLKINLYIRHYKKAIKYLKKILEIPENLNDIELYEYCYRQEIRYYQKELFEGIEISIECELMTILRTVLLLGVDEGSKLLPPILVQQKSDIDRLYKQNKFKKLNNKLEGNK